MILPKNQSIFSLWMCLSVFLTFVVLFSNSVQAKMYKWIDDQGNAHITSNESKIPKKYRKINKGSCRNLPKSLEGCVAFQCTQTKWILGDNPIDHSIEGIKMEKCLYKQIHSKTKVNMTCKLSEKLRKEYADSIWDLFDKRPSSYRGSPRSDLHNVYLACKAFWADNGSDKKCSAEIASKLDYGYVNRSGFKITANGFKQSFHAEAYDSKTNQKLSIDHLGQIKGGKPPKDIDMAMRKECVITQNGKVVRQK